MVERIEDENYSGANPNRSDLLRILELAETGQIGALREEAEAIRREEERERTKTEDTRLVAGRLGVAKLVPENLDALTGPRGANSTAVWG